MKRHRLPAVSILCLLLVGLLWACGPADEPAAEADSDDSRILRYDVNAPFLSLDPMEAETSGTTNVFPLLYSFLFVPRTDGELIPDLATHWVFDAEKRQWTFRLRTDARFHDGRPVTARDVQFSLQAHIQGQFFHLRSVIDRIAASADHEIRIHLRRGAFLDLNAIWTMEIVPATMDGNGRVTDRPVGSGPFRFASRQERQQVVLSANADYYGVSPTLARIVFQYQPDREMAWVRLLGGATDIAQEISPRNFRITRELRDRFYFDTYAIPFYTILLYNTKDPLFADPVVRTALTLAIDREHIVRHILNDNGRVAAGPMGFDSPFADPRLRPLPHDPDRSRELLARAGWVADAKGRLSKDREPFEFTLLLFEEGQVDRKVARFIQLCLNNIGIRVKLETHPFEKVKASYLHNDRFQAVLTELNGAYQNLGFIAKMWAPGDHGPSWAGCFAHAAVSRLLEKAFAAVDPAEKKQSLQQADRLIADLQPGTFLYQKIALDVMSRRFHLRYPFTLDQAGIHRLRFALPDTKRLP